MDAGELPAIPPGPVQQAVRALEPPVQGCGIGAFGEIGKGLSGVRHADRGARLMGLSPDKS